MTDIELESCKVYHPDPDFDGICDMLGQIRHAMAPLTPLNMDVIRADFAKRAKVDVSLLRRGSGDKRRPLRIHVLRRFPYELISSNGSINQLSESMRVARDGRALAISCEFAAAKLFGLRIATSGTQQDYDAFGVYKKRSGNVLTTHAIRTLTTHGVKCVKSSKVGGGRKSTDEDVVKYARSVDSMIFIDVTSVHTFSIIDIPSESFLALLKRSGKIDLDPVHGDLMKKIKYPAFWDAVLKSFYLEFEEVDHTDLMFQDITASLGSGTTSLVEVQYLLNQIKYELGHKLRIVAAVEARMRNNPYFHQDAGRMASGVQSNCLKRMVKNHMEKAERKMEGGQTAPHSISPAFPSIQPQGLKIRRRATRPLNA